MPSTDDSAFTADLQQRGFGEIETKSVPGGRHNPEHTHPFEVRALVTAGDITLTVAGVRNVYRAGDAFTVAAGCLHVEDVGPEGVTYLIGRKKV